MNGKVSKYLKRTNERLVASVHFSKEKTDSVESLVVEDDLADDEEVETAPKDTRVDIVIDDVSNQNDIDAVNVEDEQEVKKPKRTIWTFFKWLWAHLRLRKWAGRGLQAFGQGFMYTSPMSATVVIAQEFDKRHRSYNGGSSSKYHQTHVF